MYLDDAIVRRDDRHVVLTIEQLPESVKDDLVIVDENNANRHGGFESYTRGYTEKLTMHIFTHGAALPTIDQLSR